MQYVKVDLKPLARFREAVESDLEGVGNGPIRKAIRRWALRFRSFLQERFDRYSKGGGNWAALAAATIARRRKGVKGSVSRSKRAGARSSLMRTKSGGLADAGGTFAILVDRLASLKIALTPTFENAPGQLENHIPFGVEVGFGGPSKHPGGAATIADIASFHQEGNEHLPQRKIVVPPDTTVFAAMTDDMASAVATVAKGAG